MNIQIRLITTGRTKIDKLQRELNKKEDEMDAFASLCKKYGISCATCEHNCSNKGKNKKCFCLDYSRKEAQK